MKNITFPVALFLLSSALVAAQELRLTGTVKDGENAEIPFANIIITSALDSSLVKGTSADEAGYFELNSLQKGDYLLIVSYLGNTSEPQKIALSTDLDLGVVTLEETTFVLKEAVVTFKNPTVERKVDRLVFNIENTPLSESSIWDALKKTPSVVIVNNEITIKGSSDIQVMINERKVNLPKQDIINLLSGASANHIETIEVITTPPAKFSAEGGMIINIKMKKGLLSGYNGAVYNRYTQGVFAKHTVGTDHYFKSQKTDFSLNYSLGNNKELTRYTDKTSFFDDEISVWTANQENIVRLTSHNISTFFDWELNEKNSLSLSSINAITPWTKRSFITRTNIEDLDGSLNSFFDTDNDSDAPFINLSFYLDYVHKLNKEGASLSLGGHYTHYTYSLDQNLDTRFFDANGNLTGINDFVTESEQKINLLSLQADFSSPLSENLKLEAGVRYTGINSLSEIAQFGFDRTQPGIDPTEAGLFNYDETIYASYVGLNGKLDKLSFTSGLRAEYTEAIGDLDIAEDITENNYLELFPNFSILYALGEKHDLNLYYYRRINRPRYNSINPFQSFQSNNIVVEGNPKLLPSTRNYTALGYTYDKNYTVEVFYMYQNNPFQALMFQDNDSRLLRYINVNMDNNVSYGIDFTVNTELTPIWDLYILSSFFENSFSFQDDDSGQIIRNERFSWFFRTYNSFTFLTDKSLWADLSFNYFSPISSGNSEQSFYSSLDIALTKSFWNKSMVLTMGIQDIFNQAKLLNTRRFLNQDNSTSYRDENRLFTLGLRYKFGNVKIKDNRKSKNLDERNRL